MKTVRDIGNFTAGQTLRAQGAIIEYHKLAFADTYEVECILDDDRITALASQVKGDTAEDEEQRLELMWTEQDAMRDKSVAVALDNTEQRKSAAATAAVINSDPRFGEQVNKLMEAGLFVKRGPVTVYNLLVDIFGRKELGDKANKAKPEQIEAAGVAAILRMPEPGTWPVGSEQNKRGNKKILPVGSNEQADYYREPASDTMLRWHDRLFDDLNIGHPLNREIEWLKQVAYNPNAKNKREPDAENPHKNMDSLLAADKLASAQNKKTTARNGWFNAIKLARLMHELNNISGIKAGWIMVQNKDKTKTKLDGIRPLEVVNTEASGIEPLSITQFLRINVDLIKEKIEAGTPAFTAFRETRKRKREVKTSTVKFLNGAEFLQHFEVMQGWFDETNNEAIASLRKGLDDKKKGKENVLLMGDYINRLQRMFRPYEQDYTKFRDQRTEAEKMKEKHERELQAQRNGKTEAA